MTYTKTIAPTGTEAGFDLDKLEALALAATPGPWRAGSWTGHCKKPSHAGGKHPGPQGNDPCVYEPVFMEGLQGIAGPEAAVVSASYDGLEMSEANAEFIVAVRNALPALIALARRAAPDSTVTPVADTSDMPDTTASALRAAYDALRFYVDASDAELAERGISRADALRIAREAEAHAAQPVQAGEAVTLDEALYALDLVVNKMDIPGLSGQRAYAQQVLDRASLAPVSAQQGAAEQHNAVECDSALRAEPASQHNADAAARAWMESHGYGNQSFGFALADLQARIEAKDREGIVLVRQVHELLNHCPDAECDTCAEIICPHGEPLHFHHDGCPACTEHEAETQDQSEASRCRAEGGDTSDKDSSDYAAKAPAAQAVGFHVIYDNGTSVDYKATEREAHAHARALVENGWPDVNVRSLAYASPATAPEAMTSEQQPAEAPYGYVLKTGHGNRFSEDLAHVHVEVRHMWKPVYLAAPAPAGVEDAGRVKALHAAVAALYFDDSSDFRSALGSVVRYLDPSLAGDMLGSPKAAYDKACALLSAHQAKKMEGA